jgi:hypothetical protein
VCARPALAEVGADLRVCPYNLPSPRGRGAGGEDYPSHPYPDLLFRNILPLGFPSITLQEKRE